MPGFRPLVWSFALLLGLHARASWAAPGDPDTTFGSGGSVTTAITALEDTAFAVAEQPDGNVIAVGRARTHASYDFAVVRHLPNGALDPAFGTGGVVTTPIASGTDVPHGLALLSDGRIAVAGWAFIAGHVHDFGVVRYLPDGSLDPGWNGTGKVTTNIGPAPKSDDAPYDLVLQSDGKLVAAGETFNPTTRRTDFALVRYRSDGGLDAGFGGTGIVVTPIGLGGSARALVLRADGKLVAAGRSDAPDGFHPTLVRYQPDGTPDPSFGGTGVVVTPLASGEGIAWAVALQPDGALVVAGERYDAATQTTAFLLARHLEDGSLDPSFGDGGLVVTPIGSTSGARGLVLQGAHLVVAGTATLNGTEVPVLARYDIDGALDPTFGQGGIVAPAGCTRCSGEALAVQQDGKLLIAGAAFFPATGRDFMVARFEGEPPGSTTSTSSSTSTSLTTTSTSTSVTETSSSTSVTDTSTSTSTIDTSTSTSVTTSSSSSSSTLPTTTSTSEPTSSTSTTLADIVQASFRSTGAEDGSVIESSETSDVGGIAVPVDDEIQIGDQVSDRQFKGILSFDTSGIPDGAVVLEATLRLRRAGLFGTNPFIDFGACRIDVRTGAFGDDATLAPSDFEAPATVAGAGLLGNALANGQLSTGTIDAAGLAAINRTGITQLRIAFDLDDNDDAGADRIRYNSGDAADPSLRPELIVTYAP